MAVLGGWALSYERGTPVRVLSIDGGSDVRPAKQDADLLFFFLITLQPRVE